MQIRPCVPKIGFITQLYIFCLSRLSLTLRFLATGETFQSLAISCRIAPTTVSKIVRETLGAIVKRLGPIYLQVCAFISMLCGIGVPSM